MKISIIVSDLDQPAAVRHTVTMTRNLSTPQNLTQRAIQLVVVGLGIMAGSTAVCNSQQNDPSSLDSKNSDPLSLAALSYFGKQSYRDALTKDYAQLYGLYLSTLAGREHLIEAEADFIDISYLQPPKWKQQDLTLAYANYSTPNLKLRMGGHFVNSDDETTHGGRAFFAGTRYYIPYSWEAGVDGSFSTYPNTTNGMSVSQITLCHGFNLCYGDGWYCHSDTRGYWIHTGDIPGLGKSDFYSVEEKVAFNWYPWSVAVYGWTGEQVYAIKNDGFVLFNLAEQHKSGYGLEAGFAFTKALFATIRLSRENYKEIGRDADVSASQYLFMVCYKW